MTVLFENRFLDEVPLLLAFPAGSAPYPTVLWFHGFTVDKDTNRTELQLLAEAGLLAVGVDVAGHGQRRLADFEQRFSGDQDQVKHNMHALVAQTTAEIPRIFDQLCGAEMADPQRLGAIGVSMGAHITYGAVVHEPRLRAAVAMLGSPSWPAENSPSHYLDRFFPTALLSMTAEYDEVVPPIHAAELHCALESHYGGLPERLRYEELSGEWHFLNQATWDYAMRASCDWLTRFLLAARWPCNQ